MANLSFAIALNLITSGFKKGTDEVRNGMNSIKSSAMSVAAYFGVGFLGIKAVFDKIKDAGLQTAKAINTLKANSGGIIQTGQNLRFVRDVADKYKLELTGLITEYSKFTASATTAGFSIKQQQSIFEGVQKAIKGYRLSEEDSSTVMASLQKMMNTGTISTRNFTNSFLKSMPQAKKALADAMDVGVDKINALVKKGIDAKKVLESFAKNLQMQSPTIDVSDIGSAKNRIANTFSGIAEDTKVTKFVANTMNKVADLIEYIRTNACSLAYTIGGLLAGIKIAQFFRQWQIFSKTSSSAMVTNATIAHSKVRSLEASTNRLKKQIAAMEVQTERASADERLAIEVQLSAKKKELNSQELLLTKAKNTAKVADERAAAVQSGNAWTSSFAKIKTGAAALGASLKAVWATAGPMILITIATELIAKFVEIYNRAKAIKNAYSDYKAEAAKAIHTREIIELESLQKEYNKTKKDSKERRELEKRIGDELGKHVTGASKINSLINDRIKLLRTAAEIEFYTNKSLELQSRQEDLKRKYGGFEPTSKEGQDIVKKQKSSGWWGLVSPLMGAVSYINNKNINQDVDEYINNKKLISENEKRIAEAEQKAGAMGLGRDSGAGLDDGGGGGKTGRHNKKENPAADELTQIETNYAQQLRELAAKKKLEEMSDSDYNKSLSDLTVQTLVQVSSSKYSSVRNSEFAKNLDDASKKIKENKLVADLNSVMAEFQKNADELKKQRDANSITQNEYAESMSALADKTQKEVVSVTDVNNSNADYVNAIFDAVSGLTTFKKGIRQDLPKEETRDTTFDYKKSDTDIMSEQLDIAKKRLDDLNSVAVKDTEQMVSEINKQMGRVTTLKEALKLEEVKKDVKEFAKTLREQTWGSIKSIVSGSDQIVNSWERLGDTLNNADASGWDKIMAIWSALENSVDGILGIIDAVNSWTKASKQLQSAKTAEAAITTATNTEEASSTIAAASVSTATAEMESNENKKTISGNIAAAGSEVIKQNSKIPVVGLALAATGLIALIALMGKLPKFAKGGIVGGGSTSGDNMLARVNSGEMILNGSQQKRLFNAINGGALGGETQIALKSGRVRGSDMYLAIDNYMKSNNKRWSR